MELRDIEIFLVLSEELHFARTADRLHVTASRVSHAIRTQERRIGARLFERTSRTVRLTLVGEQLARDLRPAYQQILDAIDAATTTAHTGPQTLTIGVMGPQSWMIRDLVDRFRHRHPTTRLVERDLNPIDPLTPLRSGTIDLAHLWLPVDEPDISTGPITHTSPLALILDAGHPYASRQALVLEDYGDLVFPAHRSPIPARMEAAFQPVRTPSGRPIPRGTTVDNWDDLLKAVHSGHIVAATAAEAAQFYPWPGLVYIPVRDAPPVRWGLAWRADDRNPLIRDLANAVDTGA